MKIYHQLGHNEVWNIDAFDKGHGDGLIFSPINLPMQNLSNINLSIRQRSFLDPQLYLPSTQRGKLVTYPYFPGKASKSIKTSDLEASSLDLAKLCVDFQVRQDFEYVVIPTRHFEHWSSKRYGETSETFIYPICEYCDVQRINKKILLSVIVKKSILLDEDLFDEALNWITGQNGIAGVYLIFEHGSTSKQLKDSKLLRNAINFIRILKENEMEVHVGYANTEGLLYSVAMPDSITMGSYENVRSFDIKRFQEKDGEAVRGPHARLYSSRLLQWVEYTYIKAMEAKVPNYDDLFDDSEYKPLMFRPSFEWHFSKPEPYKHYFKVFPEQSRTLGDTPIERKNHLQHLIDRALSNFKYIEEMGVLLDQNSDGSHLKIWNAVLNEL